MSEVFSASVQYNDWKGTAAADDADNLSVQAFFRANGLPIDAHIVAVRAYYLSAAPGKISVRGVYADGRGFDSVQAQIESADTLRFKEIELELTFADFFKMFKRFNVVLPQKGLGLEGREYTSRG